MKIYTVVDAILHEVQVEKETPKTYRVERSRATNYASVVFKEEAFLTPEEAIKDAVLRKQSALSKLHEAAGKVEREIEKLVSLRLEIEKDKKIEL